MLLLVAIALLLAVWIAAFGRLLEPLMRDRWCGWRTSNPEAPLGTVDLWLQQWGLPVIAVSFAVTVVASLIVLRRRAQPTGGGPP